MVGNVPHFAHHQYAGLSAVGTAKSMGAIVRVFDTRAAVAEQVRLSVLLFGGHLAALSVHGIHMAVAGQIHGSCRAGRRGRVDADAHV